MGVYVRDGYIRVMCLMGGIYGIYKLKAKPDVPKFVITDYEAYKWIK